MPAVTRAAQLIAQMEGFGRPGTVPTRDNNPGDLRHSPHSTHPNGDPNSIGVIDTVDDGWDDEERQLRLYAERGLTLRQVVYEYAPPSDKNNTAKYLAFMCQNLPAAPDTPFSEVLKIPARA